MTAVRLSVGSRLWNGATVTPHLAAAYNSLSERIERFADEGRAAPEQLLNGRHNLIASAPNYDDKRHCELVALNVDAMTAIEIYDNRAAIGRAVTLAIEEARDYLAESDCRAHGYTLRRYAESIGDRLQSVTRP